MKFVWKRFVFLMLVLSACSATPTPLPSTSVMPSPEPVTLLPSATAPQYPWEDAAQVMSGVCFEAADALAGQVIVLRSADAHIAFYNQLDAMGVCRQPVTRYPFEFSSGQVLAGMWSRGAGCDARHEVIEVQRDDVARVLTVRLRLVVTGECRYELVQPFWMGLTGLTDYEIRLSVEA